MSERSISESVRCVLRWKETASGYRQAADALDHEVIGALGLIDEEARGLTDEELGRFSMVAADPKTQTRERAIVATEDKPPRKTRADKGQSRTKPDASPADAAPAVTTRKPHVLDGRASPLTDDLRMKLNATLEHGPLQLTEIERMSWATGLDVEALLCEDDAAFVRWEDGGAGGPVVWGTADRFDRAVGSMTIQCSKEQRPKFTAAALGCSVKAALDSWNRLDPWAAT